ncbi:hypothetical protein BH23BAC1_BH23BAC1_29190 [soil metagenome]
MIKVLTSQFFSDIITGRELINKALAGVGKPINVLACRVSTLKFANLKAENTASKNEL